MAKQLNLTQRMERLEESLSTIADKLLGETDAPKARAKRTPKIAEGDLVLVDEGDEIPFAKGSNTKAKADVSVLYGVNDAGEPYPAWIMKRDGRNEKALRAFSA